jgi:hypothetical protein
VDGDARQQVAAGSPEARRRTRNRVPGGKTLRGQHENKAKEFVNLPRDLKKRVKRRRRRSRRRNSGGRWRSGLGRWQRCASEERTGGGAGRGWAWGGFYRVMGEEKRAR